MRPADWPVRHRAVGGSGRLVGSAPGGEEGGSDGRDARTADMAASSLRERRRDPRRRSCSARRNGAALLRLPDPHQFARARARLNPGVPGEEGRGPGRHHLLFPSRQQEMERGAQDGDRPPEGSAPGDQGRHRARVLVAGRGHRAEGRARVPAAQSARAAEEVQRRGEEGQPFRQAGQIGKVGEVRQGEPVR